jgi:hypothetical protein
MQYFVTHGSGERAAPIALDLGGTQGFDLKGALAYAHSLLTREKGSVTIRDSARRSITGADLEACCNGNKTLTPDLEAVAT